jgi:hypothetical protein
MCTEKIVYRCAAVAFFCTAGQEQPAFIAALHEKYVENCGEEDSLIIWTRCQNNIEKTRE